MKTKVGIICASDTELKPFIPIIEKCITEEKSMLKFNIGKINGVSVVAVFSGVCKVNAAIATQICIDRYGCNIIINAGTAGGINTSVNTFDTIISTEVAYHDVSEEILTEFHPWMDSIYFKADNRLLAVAEKSISMLHNKYNVIFGRMVTGEMFINDDKREYIESKYKPLSVDMETASIAHVCYVNKVPFISIRTITDTSSNRGVEEFEKNCDKASQISTDIVTTMLGEIDKC